MYALSINKQRHEDYGGVRWPAVAARRTAPQFRNAVLKFNFFNYDHSSCLCNTKIYEKNAYVCLLKSHIIYEDNYLVVNNAVSWTVQSATLNICGIVLLSN